VHCLYHTIDRYHVGRVAHVNLFLLTAFENTMESGRHLLVEFFKDFILRPVEVHIVLDLFEVGSGHAAGVAQEVRNIEDVILLEIFISFGCAGTVRAFGHDLDVLGHLGNCIRIDLPFHRGRDQYIGFLGDPGIAVFNSVTCILSLRLVDRAILIHDGEQEARINSAFLAVGERLLFTLPKP
jgi:hypothetical protein